MSRRLSIEMFIWCAGVSFLMHFAPTAYAVRQIYELTGNAAPAQENPSLLAAAIKAQPEIGGTAEKIQCAAVAFPRFECRVTARQKSAARELARQLREAVPPKMGWVKRETLAARLRDTRAGMALRENDAASLEAELREMEAKAATAEKNLTAAGTSRAKIDAEIAARKKQLQIIQEATPSREPGKERARFEAKQEEISKRIADLQKQLDAADKQFIALSVPLERKKEVLETLPKVRAQIDLARAQIASWDAVLKSAQNAETVADPDGFQAAAIELPDAVVPVRGWSHLSWSFPLGLLLFSLVRARHLAGWRERYFNSPEEVETATGLSFLGRV